MAKIFLRDKLISITVIFFILLSFYPVSSMAAPLLSNNNKNIIFQVATASAVAQRVYDGDYNYKKLMQHGDFGLGTFLDLDGEMVAVDGNFYQIQANGKLYKVNPKQIMPFAEVTFFNPAIHKTLVDISNYEALDKILLNMFPNKNIAYAIRIDGKFKSIKLRSLRKQKKPYPPLVKATEEQGIFNLQNVTGTIVGFWFPKYWAGIAVPEFHLHFVTADRTAGGHVLDVSVSNGELSLEAIQQIQVYLPNTNSFSQANLSAEDIQTSLKKVEEGS